MPNGILYDSSYKLFHLHCYRIEGCGRYIRYRSVKFHVYLYSNSIMNDMKTSYIFQLSGFVCVLLGGISATAQKSSGTVETRLLRSISNYMRSVWE